MDIQIFKKLMKTPSRYFPTIALFWILDQTNTNFDLFLLLLAFGFWLIYENMIKYLASKIDKKKIKKLFEQQKRTVALDTVCKEVKPKKLIDLLYYGLMVSILLLFNIYTFYRLIPFWQDKIAEFFIIVGIIAFLKGSIVFCYHLFRQFKQVIKEELFVKS